ncbi:unnamed protein product [Adineta steineri]|uniref:Granulins domain-containing protein n=1 Tax=Adineta steineri TaxID=433720 RepID=A0A815KAV1_9BILA|nr:unnamed protein product [Adineta steineri]
MLLYTNHKLVSLVIDPGSRIVNSRFISEDECRIVVFSIIFDYYGSIANLSKTDHKDLYTGNKILANKVTLNTHYRIVTNWGDMKRIWYHQSDNKICIVLEERPDLFIKSSSAVGSNTVPCPGGSSSCPDGSTCCQLSSGEYGCCPLVDAVCCSDHLHCCPQGTTCDVEHSRCNKFVNVKDVPCPGGSSSCPDGSTCCQLQSGQYGCCPLADAVCCSDHLHCCPQGTTCDVEHSRCKQKTSIPWFKKTAAIPNHQPLVDIVVDGKTKNHDDSVPIRQIAKAN